MSDGKNSDEVIFERAVAGEPQKGKVFIAIHSHLDDIPRYCAGTLVKLIREGFTFDQFHHDAVATAGFFQAVNLCDVRMIERR